MDLTAGVHFDLDTMALLKRILIEAEQSIPSDARSFEVSVRLASGILAAAGGGERDPERLRRAALREIDRQIVRPGSIESI
jgi:hypothetical protein